MSRATLYSFSSNVQFLHKYVGFKVAATETKTINDALRKEMELSRKGQCEMKRNDRCNFRIQRGLIWRPRGYGHVAKTDLPWWPLKGTTEKWKKNADNLTSRVDVTYLHFFLHFNPNSEQICSWFSVFPLLNTKSRIYPFRRGTMLT